MYFLNEVKHNVHIQCHGNYIELKMFNYMLEIDILRNSSQMFGGVLKGDFGGYGHPNDAQTPC